MIYKRYVWSSPWQLVRKFAMCLCLGMAVCLCVCVCVCLCVASWNLDVRMSWLMFKMSVLLVLLLYNTSLVPPCHLQLPVSSSTRTLTHRERQTHTHRKTHSHRWKDTVRHSASHSLTLSLTEECTVTPCSSHSIKEILRERLTDTHTYTTDTHTQTHRGYHK